MPGRAGHDDGTLELIRAFAKGLLMRIFNALFVLLFRSYAPASAVRGGSGHYNEQCHPQTYS